MSYSRWLNSYWYTYWQYRGDENRDNAMFAICTIETFTAKQIRDDIDWCLAQVTKSCCERKEFKRQPTTSEMAELRGYMLEFLDDIEQEYGIVEGTVEP